MNRLTLPRLRLAVAGLLLLSLAPSTSSANTPTPENKWRIQCSEGANSAGAIVFRVTPEGGAPIEVSVEIKDGKRELRRPPDPRRLRRDLPKEAFDAEVDDGEDVLVKKHLGAPSFSLELVSNSVKGVRINLDRE